jgi:predicted Zn-dependent peptidase
MGSRRNIERFSRDMLVDYVRRQYTGANLVVGVAGAIDPDRIVAVADAVFGALPAGTPNDVEPAAYVGGIGSRRLSVSSQAHAVIGFPIPRLADDDAPSVVAAALFGEGMSSPLLDELRERRGLAYYTACSADVLEMCGQFVVEASTASAQIAELLTEVLKLLRRQAERIDGVDFERALRQIAVRRLRAHERAYRRLEDAALDLFALGRVRSRADETTRLAQVSADDVRGAFERMLDAGVSIALAGDLPRAATERVREIVDRYGRVPA